jgi:hypothetical protein
VVGAKGEVSELGKVSVVVVCWTGAVASLYTRLSRMVFRLIPKALLVGWRITMLCLGVIFRRSKRAFAYDNDHVVIYISKGQQ